jgi:hypothetical protein
MRQVTPPPAKPTEIEVEPEPDRESAEPLVSTVQVPQAVLDAVAEADAAPVEVPVETARVASPEPVPEEAAPEATEAPEAPPLEEPAAAADAVPEAPGTDEEVSLEAILEDLKRREGRSE